MVLQIALGRLNVTGEFVVVLVGECVGNACGTAFGPHFVSAHAEFVPTGHEYDAGINLECVIPLLCEVVSPLGSLCAFLFKAIRIGGGVGTASDLVAAHGSQLVQLVVVVHCDTDRDLLYDAIVLILAGCVVLCLRIHGKPAPGSVIGVVYHVAGLTCTEGEEIRNFLFKRRGVGVKGCGDGHEHGLTVEVVPQVGVSACAEEILIDRSDLHVGVGLIPEGEHEGELGGLEAVGHGVVPLCKQRVVGVVPSVVAVGVVGENDVNAGVCQKLSLLAQHPRVVAAVEAVDGFVPPIGFVRLPDLVVEISHGLGILFAVFLQVNHVIGGKAVDVPGPVEHGNRLVVAGRANVLVCQRGSAKTVGKYPGVGVDGMGIDQRVLGDHVLLGGLMVAVDGVLGLRALQEEILAGCFLCKDHANVGIRRGAGRGEAVLINVALKAGYLGKGIHGGSFVGIVNQEQIIACGQLFEGNALQGVVNQQNAFTCQRLCGNGVSVGVLPLVNRDIDLHVGRGVGCEVEFNAREGSVGGHAHAA